MFKFKNYLVLISISLIIASCNQTKKEVSENKDLVVTDSAKMEDYYKWTADITYFNAYNYDKTVIASVEKNRDSLNILELIINNYDVIKPSVDFSIEPTELVKSVYAIDINGDNLLDIIYQGPSGVEQNITQFFINKGNHYEKVFNGYFEVIEAKFVDNKLKSLTVINPGCCADAQITEYKYVVNYTENTPKFILDSTLGYLNQTEKPQKLFPSPLQFTVLTENAKLRNDTYILDDIEHPIYGPKGNVVAIYNSKSKGTAIGYKKDDDNEWIYAVLYADNKYNSGEFTTFAEQLTAIRGWILKSDTDLK